MNDVTTCVCLSSASFTAPSSGYYVLHWTASVAAGRRMSQALRSATQNVPAASRDLSHNAQSQSIFTISCEGFQVNL